MASIVSSLQAVSLLATISRLMKEAHALQARHPNTRVSRILCKWQLS